LGICCGFHGVRSVDRVAREGEVGVALRRREVRKRPRAR
jgi:hypothetical protein